MTVHGFHGINVSDGGDGSVGNLTPAFRRRRIEYRVHDLGWIDPLTARLRARSMLERLAPQIKPSDSIVAHSHGALVAWYLLAAGVSCRSLVLIQPALRRDTVFPGGVDRVLTLANTGDRVLHLTHAMRLANPVSWVMPHRWGTAGRHGYTISDPRLTTWHTDDDHWPTPARGHSTVLRDPDVHEWGERIAQWIADHQPA